MTMETTQHKKYYVHSKCVCCSQLLVLDMSGLAYFSIHVPGAKLLDNL